MAAARKALLAREYEKSANELLHSGYLGHGIQEDLLISSAAWFHRKLVPDGGAFADFFRAAMDHHVLLQCAVDLDPENVEDAADFHDFLTVVLSWVIGFPLPILQKSPQPLKVVIGSLGTGHNLGMQVMRSGAPAVIYWGVFKSLRKSLAALSYNNLSEQIRQTLVHEIIGHQLAFCTVNGPLLQREDLRLILDACGVRFLKLVDSPSMAVEDFLASKDLLAAINRIEYYSARRNKQKYHSNITELIAFSIEGRTSASQTPYGEILTILKRNFLRVDQPLTPLAQGAGALYEGYDVSKPMPEHYFIEQIGGGWRETPALFRDGKWVTLEDLSIAWRGVLPAVPRAEVHYLEASQELFLNIASASYLLEIEDDRFLAGPFGLFSGLSKNSPQRCPPQLERGRVAVDAMVGKQDAVDALRIRNRSTTRVPFKLLPLR